MPILPPFALLDAQHHAFGIDIGYLQRDDLGDARPCTVSDAQRRLVLDAPSRLQQTRKFLQARHDGPLRSSCRTSLLGKVSSIERHVEEEPQR